MAQCLTQATQGSTLMHKFFLIFYSWKMNGYSFRYDFEFWNNNRKSKIYPYQQRHAQNMRLLLYIENSGTTVLNPSRAKEF